jgi:hypothetical protein
MCTTFKLAPDRAIATKAGPMTPTMTVLNSQTTIMMPHTVSFAALCVSKPPWAATSLSGQQHSPLMLTAVQPRHLEADS